MTSDAIIEAAARRLHEAESPRVSWDGAAAAWRATCRAGAHAIAAAGLLVDELPPEPMPHKQARMDGRGIAWQRLGEADHPWWCADDASANRSDDGVRDWPILVPETDLDDLCADRDRLVAQLAAVTRGRDRDTIREHIPAATHPTLPEGHVAVDLRGVSRPVLDAIAEWDDEPFANAARAELARRAAEAGVSS